MTEHVLHDSGCVPLVIRVDFLPTAEGELTSNSVHILAIHTQADDAIGEIGSVQLSEVASQRRFTDACSTCQSDDAAHLGAFAFHDQSFELCQLLVSTGEGGDVQLWQYERDTRWSCYPEL